ncbi:hypothetical protein EIL87_15885 [Saccharopolyspora rhizosphaerae]|uniref:Uncharacterized protein n=1 Tax=Saccharopolyspora rhizosphaerae TaxID=2492662 RepID=A0A3R8Q8M7_9PSEU|nr:hypothetical protein [Saccharopolyspora rhizosphaerae]RRO15518.1 hypothetical protein EIL87_15885 [Saccharopolyspora rhizosphaerae]
MSAQETVALVLAQAPGPPQDPGGQGEDFGKSSPLGLVLLIVFGIAVVFLIRSMTKHLKKLPVVFDEEKANAAAPARVKRAEAEQAERAEAAEEAENSEDGGSAKPPPAKAE